MTRFLQAVKDAARDAKQRIHWIVLGAALGVTCILRLYGFGWEMGHDEAYTYAALLVLAYGRTEPGSILSAYQVVREADGTDRFTQTQIFSTAASPTQMRDESGTNWWFEAYLLPVKKGERYGVALLGNEAKEQYFSGMTGVFFALRNTTLSNK